jgi:hypothetical protein
MIKLTEKTKTIMAIAASAMLLVAVMQGCGKGRKLRAINRALTEHVRADSASAAATARFMDEFDVRMRINALQIERSTLHNMNEIVLTNQRPSQRIEEINRELQDLTSKLIKGAKNEK